MIRRYPKRSYTEYETADYQFDEERDAMSEYERRFRDLGQPIHRIIIRKEGE